MSRSVSIAGTDMHAGYEVDDSLCRRGTTNDSSVGAAESRCGKLPSADVRCGWANFPSSRIVSRAAGWPDSRHHESSHQPAGRPDSRRHESSHPPAGRPDLRHHESSHRPRLSTPNDITNRHTASPVETHPTARRFVTTSKRHPTDTARRFVTTSKTTPTDTARRFVTTSKTPPTDTDSWRDPRGNPPRRHSWAADSMPHPLVKLSAWLRKPSTREPSTSLGRAP